MGNINLSKAAKLSKAKLTAMAMTTYEQYKKEYPSEVAPKLNVIVVKASTNSVTASIDKPKYPFKNATLRIQELTDIIHSKDLKSILYHEYTHIYDMSRLVGEITELSPVMTILSEIHAAYVEMRHRIATSKDGPPSLKTFIPVSTGYQSIEDHLIERQDDIISFYHESSAESLGRMWKHLQYYFGEIICLKDAGLSEPRPTVMTAIPDTIRLPLMMSANDLMLSPENIVLVATKHRQSLIDCKESLYLQLEGQK